MIDPQDYGVVYGDLWSLGTQEAFDQMLANTLGLAAAGNAAITTADYLGHAADMIQACVQPTVAGTNTYIGSVLTPTTGHFEHRGEDEDASIIDLWLDYSHYYGGLVTPTKTRKTTRTFEMTPVASGMGTNLSISASGAAFAWLNDSSLGRDFVAEGVQVGMTMLRTGWPASNNNTQAHLGVVVTAVEPTRLRYAATNRTIQSGDSDSTFSVGWVHSDDTHHIWRWATTTGTGLIQDVTFRGYDEYDGYRDMGGRAAVFSHNGSGASSFVFRRVKTLDEWAETIVQNGGPSSVYAEDSLIRGRPGLAMHDSQGAAASPNRRLKTDNCIIDCYPVMGADLADPPVKASGIYVGPHVGVHCILTAFKNMLGTATRQYSSSDRYTDFGSHLPTVLDALGNIMYKTHRRDGTPYATPMTVGAIYDRCTWTNDHPRIAELSGGGGISIITSDAPVYTEVIDPVFEPGNGTGASLLMPRCARLDIINPTWECGGLRTVDITSRRQDEIEINVIGGVTHETRGDGVGRVIHGSDAGWNLTFDEAHLFHFEPAGGVPGEIVMLEPPLDADDDYPASTLTVNDGEFVNDATSGNMGTGLRLNVLCGATVFNGGRFEGRWQSGVSFSGSESLAYVRRLTLNAVDFSEIEGSSGDALKFTTAGGFSVAEGQIDGSGNLFNETSTTAGIRLLNGTPGAQGLRPPQALDPTTRTASAGLVKLSMNFDAATVAGTVSSFQFGRGTQNHTFAFSGTRVTVVAGASFVAQAGGNVTWLETGARDVGDKIYLALTAGAWVEFLPLATIVALDATAVEGGDAGAFEVAHDGPTTLPVTVSLAFSGSATAGDDYTSLSATLVIPAGSASATITVDALEDVVLAEGIENVTATVVPGPYYTAGAPSSADVEIEDTTEEPLPWPTGTRAYAQMGLGSFPVTRAEARMGLADEPATAGARMGVDEYIAPSWRSTHMGLLEDL